MASARSSSEQHEGKSGVNGELPMARDEKLAERTRLSRARRRATDQQWRKVIWNKRDKLEKHGACCVCAGAGAERHFS